MTSLAAIADAYQSIVRHEQARQEPRRLQRLEMSLRLVRWLAIQQTRGETVPASFSEAAQRHLDEGGYLDWARYALRSGDPVRELSEAYARLWDRFSTIREIQSQQFAKLLQGWTAAGSSGQDVIPVERFLETVVAPLAAKKPVLLVVADGMSVAVSRELVSDILRQDWVPLCEEGRVSNRPAMATIPSVTEVSRTSLFCGKLQTGTAANEVAGFAEHPALLAHCRSGSPPMLFHKVGLQDAEDTSLSAAVRREIGSSHRRIVGVVINAVDDHLLKGQQLDIRWSRDEIKAFSSLLYEAIVAGRVVVLVSDHGHILDHGTHMGPVEASERWRPAEGPVTDEELLIEGSRVQLAEDHRLIAPWSEKLRYSNGAGNGYHGGLTPQEMVIPITVLNASHHPLPGWVEAPSDMPDWWDEPVGATPVEEPLPKIKPIKKKDKGLLFDLDGQEEVWVKPKDTPVSGKPQARWLSDLAASPLLKDQKKLAGRAVPTDETLTNLLTALDQRGGKMTSLALAKTLAMPAFRLRGLLAVVQRMLNIDGFAVLTRDEASDTVELNRELLIRQFDLLEE
jgi:hypothetical protein